MRAFQLKKSRSENKDVMNKKESFIKEFSHIAIGTFLNLIIGVISTPILTRLVDPTVFGQFSLFNTYVSIAMSFFSLGLDQALVRYYYTQENLGYKKKLFLICVGIPAITFSVLFIAVLGITSLLKCSFYEKEAVLGVFFFVAVLITLLNRFGMVLVRLQYKTKMYALLNTMQRLSYLLIAIPLILMPKSEKFYALIIANLLANIVCVVMEIVTERKFLLWKKQAYNQKIPVKEMVTFGFPLMVSGAVIYLFQAADKICVQYFGTYTDVGVYASAQSLMSVFSIITTSFNTLWTPKAVEHFEKNPDDTSYYRKMNQVITVLMFAFGATVLLFRDVIVLFLGEKYRGASMIIPFLMFNPIMYTISETTVQGISFKKKTGNQVLISLSVCVINYVLNILLIPLVGVVGAAMATAISYILFFTLRSMISNKYFKIDFGLKKFYFFTALFFANAAYHSFFEFSIFNVIIYIVMIVIICILYKNTVSEIWGILKGKVQSVLKNK